jgi:hypothetical protein
MPKIVEPETGQARFLGQCSPSRAPAIQVPRRIEARNVVGDHLPTAEGELGNEGREHVV